ncbi:Gfo/Idh/MocA family oxidoreductase [Schlesneria paludicola]|uniref:Gfo/Idh/MocA family oxidoreductase n=1 Tax=Schlesneria paludicola TaxID=360056 RepID=UPI00029B221B|nr:Gfo/Idh/MocA family oxidoreductase [Schlesneria paludicola]
MRSMILTLPTCLLSLMALSLLAADTSPGLDLLNGGQSANTVRAFKELARWKDLQSWPTSLAFSPDNKTLAIGLKDAVELVDLETKSVTGSFPVKSGQVRGLVFSPDGTHLATASYQHATLFDAKTHAAVRELGGHRGYVTSIAFSRDGRRIATACEDEIARVWNMDQNDQPVTLKGHAYPVTGVAWSADGAHIATSAGDDTRPTKPGQVRIWDAASGMLQDQFELHAKAATCVTFTPDGHYLLSGSIDEHVNVYDLQAKKPLGFFGGHSRPTIAVAVYPDGETAISVSGGRAVGKNELMAWEIESGDVMASIEAHEAKITSLAVSADGRMIATASQDRSVALWSSSFLTVGLAELAAADVAPPKESNAEQVVQTNQPSPNTQAASEPKARVLRAGIIGLDTSHAIAFSKTLNAATPVAGAENCRVVAAYPKGSPDIKSSLERVPSYTEELKSKHGVEIVDSIDELLKRVDVVMLETNDGRPHLEQLLPVLKAKKPCFIDKPIAGTLSDAIAIFELAKQAGVPVFSTSSLRYGKNTQEIRGGSLGKVTFCETSSPASLEPTHPDLFWYGIHGTESLFTVMGTGCQSVVRGKTPDGKIEVTGQWGNGRVGIYREGSGYQGKAIGEKGEAPAGSYDGYDPLVLEIVKFFRTGQVPVSPEETLEIYAFMEAADESKRQNGASVTLESVMAKAREEANQKIAALKAKIQ